MVIYMKGNLQIIYFMELGNIFIIMVTHMKVNFYMVQKKEKVCINALIYMNMMVIGIMIYLVVLGNYLIGKKVELSKALGDMEKLWNHLIMKKALVIILRILI